MAKFFEREMRIAAVFAISVLVIVGASVSAQAGTTSNLDQASGWTSCDACSGIHQAGPKTLRSVSHVGSPSMDGHAMQLWIGGNNRYGSALFWKSLGTTKTRHFKTDLYFYIKNFSASQALEFDIYQNLNGKHFVLGAECSLKTSHRWSVYDTKYQHWRPTSAVCNYLAPFKWHHLVIEEESVASGHSHMIAITLDGTKHYMNKYYSVRAGSGSGSTLGLQLDGNSTMTDYAVWYDKVSVTRY